MIRLKRKIKNKIFHDNHCRCKNKKRIIHRHLKYNGGSNTKRNRLVVCAPKELSVFEYTSQTLAFFENIMNLIKQCKVKDNIYFDLSQVVYITPDVVMYLIAIINNTKKIKSFDICCQGNMPNNLEARSVFQETGFFKFVYAQKSQNIKNDSKNMKIENGSQADSKLAGAFCNFVHMKSGKDYNDTKRLYPMIVELMTNTFQHAYKPIDRLVGHLEMNCNWYIFAQDIGKSIQFIFLDTGVGIPRTVARKLTERIKDHFNSNNDALYLESALKGDFSRSETRLSYRGKGLPGIYEDCCKKGIYNLRIISGKATCFVKDDSNIESQSINQYFDGTMFTWEIIK